MCKRFYVESGILEVFKSLYGFDAPILMAPFIAGELQAFDKISVIHHEDGLVVRPMHWNLIPAQNPQFNSELTWFNTTVESLEKEYQATSLRYRRCVVPVSRFYETKSKGGKTIFHKFKDRHGQWKKRAETYSFSHAGNPLMLLGAIYDVWNGDNRGERHSVSIITLPPNQVVGEVHTRMPYILNRETAHLWLNPAIDQARQLIDLIQPFPDNLLKSSRIFPRELPQQNELF